MVIRIFIEKKKLNKKAFAALWSALQTDFFQPVKYGKSEPFRNTYNADVPDIAYGYFKELEFFFVKGQRTDLLHLFFIPSGGIVCFSFQVENAPNDTLISWFDELQRATELLYAFAGTQKEYDYKHLNNREVNGVKISGEIGSSGRDFQRSLPGLYGFNLFGLELKAALWEEKPKLPPSFKWLDCGAGTCIFADDGLRENLPALVKEEKQVAELIGETYFFDRNKSLDFTYPPKFAGYIKKLLK